MKYKYTTILLSTALLLASIVMQAQTNQFRIVDGIPHLPVITNTTAVTSPVTGAMVFSQSDDQAMVYNGAAWYGLTDLPDPVGSDSEPYFRVVNGMPCMAVTTSGSMFEPSAGLVYYADSGDQGLIVGDGSGYSPITDFVGSGSLNEKAMVSSGLNKMLAMPVLNTAPTGITAGAFYLNATTNQFEVYNGSAWQTLNTPPEVSNVSVSGTLGVGQTVSASYTYIDAENDPEGATSFQWYRAISSTGAGSTAISGATTQSYTITSNDEGYYMGVKVTPVASSGITPGDAVTNYTSTAVPVPVCPSETLTKTHYAGSVAPVTQEITYQLVETDLGTTNGTKQCWIAQNLGATTQATSATDPSDAAAGWYWQFNRKQGYAINTNGTPTSNGDDVRTPSTPWITPIDENSDWTLANDPCRLLLGGAWRLPTRSEWLNANSNGSWNNYNDTYSSVLKVHTAGYLNYGDFMLNNRGTYGFYWSSSQSGTTRGYYLRFHSSDSEVRTFDKPSAWSVRCLMD